MVKEKNNETIRKVFLNDLPKRKGNINQINWKKSIGYSVKFIYDDIKGTIKIIDYSPTSRKLTLRYLNNDNFKMNFNSFKNGMLGTLIGIVSKEYRYNIGDIIKLKNSKVKILEQIKIKYNKNSHKAYKYICQECGNVDKITEGHIREGKGCPVCSNQKVLKGYNDIATTHSHLLKYFVNKEEAYKYSYGTDIKILVKCPECNSKRMIKISKLIERGFCCQSCGDGISKPEKFMLNILEQLDINFIKEKIFNWSKNIKYNNIKLCGNKKYDFYIPSLNCIIETHGEQHYTKSFNLVKHGKTLQEEQENDKLKERLAKENGIEHYIVIDCRKSELDFIKSSILNSRLNELFDLSKIDWNRCEKFACSSLVKKACDLWNEGIRDTNKISKIMKVTLSTTIRYLKQGKNVGLCDYETKYHIKNKNLFLTCELWNKGYNKKEISSFLKIKIYNINNYLNEGNKLKLCNYNGSELRKKALQKKILCVEKNIIFDSVTDASEKSLAVLNKKLHVCNISEVCRGNRKTTGGYHFKYI